MLSFTRVHFRRFKAFNDFTLDIRRINILVGPNNAGKSTTISAFKILSAGLRKARNRNATIVHGKSTDVLGYSVDISAISIAEENIFHNYDDDLPAEIRFTLTNNCSITLLFPEVNVCSMFVESSGVEINTTSAFKKLVEVEVGFVPILGPVEHREPLYEKETALKSLYNYKAARNFRNIWFHFPTNFERLKEEIGRTWPGMDIKRPERYYIDNKPYLSMYFVEGRLDRELYWSGFGFQVWCQMLTHLIASKKVSLFLIDEPDIYLHSDLQRQLLGILRQLGPDILIATHSTELVSEAESEELVLINKQRKRAKRIRKSNDVNDVLSVLGSGLNLTLTQIAKTRRVLFVEGKDFDIIKGFARKIDESGVANKRDFAVIELDGFIPEKIGIIREGIESALGSTIICAAILDRDYRSSRECEAIKLRYGERCDFFVIHECKEIENFLLVSTAIERAASRKGKDRARRAGGLEKDIPSISSAINDFCNSVRFNVQSQLLDFRRRYERDRKSGMHDAVLMEEELKLFEVNWSSERQRLAEISGKDALNAVNGVLQPLNLAVTNHSIIEAMSTDEVAPAMKSLVVLLSKFSSRMPQD